MVLFDRACCSINDVVSLMLVGPYTGRIGDCNRLGIVLEMAGLWSHRPRHRPSYHGRGRVQVKCERWYVYDRLQIMERRAVTKSAANHR
jgi:hypothetical protein